MSPTTLWLSGVVFLAFTVETAAGFGSTLVSLTLGALFLPLEGLMAVVVPTNLVLSALVAGRDGAAIDGRLLVGRVLPAMGLGMGAALWAFGDAPGQALTWAFALFVITLAAVELWRMSRASGPAPAMGVGAQWAWLVAAGVAHGVFAASGPIVVFVTSRVLPDKRAFRATLAMLWLSLNVVLVTSYVRRGLLTRDTLLLSLGMVLPLLLGMRAGDWLHHRLDAVRFRRGVFVLMLGAGAGLLARA